MDLENMENMDNNDAQLAKNLAVLKAQNMADTRKLEDMKMTAEYQTKMLQYTGGVAIFRIIDKAGENGND